MNNLPKIKKWKKKKLVLQREKDINWDSIKVINSKEISIKIL
jgi:hypothetical protein